MHRVLEDVGTESWLNQKFIICAKHQLFPSV